MSHDTFQAFEKFGKNAKIIGKNVLQLLVIYVLELLAL